MGKRQLKNWLESFLEWVLPRSEAPRSMAEWSGLFTLAAMMKRKVWWDRRLMGSYDIFPNLYVVLVGDPAVVRKSTTVGQSETILTNLGIGLNGASPITFAGDVTSHSKLLDALAASSDASLAIVSSEFSSLLQTTPKFSWQTWAHGDKVIEKPVVNLIAATTPAWISKQPPEYFVGGGFASRILFLFEEQARIRELYYDHVNYEKMKELEQKLTEDLAHIGTLEGTFSHDTNKTKEAMRQWYIKGEQASTDTRMKGYYGRKHLHAHKIAGLLSLCERDDLKITMKHFKASVKMLDYIEQKMPRAFSTLGANPFAVMMDDILGYVEQKGKCSMQQLAARFYTHGYTLEQLKSAAAFLRAAGKLKIGGNVEAPTFEFLEK
jgi:hypothetical protein